MVQISKEAYLAETGRTRVQRLQWFQEARFGMFVHWVSTPAWPARVVMNHECIPVADYEKLAATWRPKERPAREWARLARDSGMKYMVMTTKHHEGFCLWDTKQTDYNAVKRGPKRDLVREYVDACREFGLRIGFLLLVDGLAPSRRRSVRVRRGMRAGVSLISRGAVSAKLCSNYGKIDILWYDVARPFETPEDGQCRHECHGATASAGYPDQQSLAPRRGFRHPRKTRHACRPGARLGSMHDLQWLVGLYAVSDRLAFASRRRADAAHMRRQRRQPAAQHRTCPDGSVPPQAVERLAGIGQWVAQNGEAMYGRMDETPDAARHSALGGWSLKGNTVYFWFHRWVGSESSWVDS